MTHNGIIVIQVERSWILSWIVLQIMGIPNMPMKGLYKIYNVPAVNYCNT